MSGYISPAHRVAKEQLTLELASHIGTKWGGLAQAARRLDMDPSDLAKILRMDRPVSLSKLADIGHGLGLSLSMEWRRRDGSAA